MNALSKIACNSKENNMILDDAGTAIAQIWIRRNKLNLDIYKKYDPEAQDSIKQYIKHNKPDWSVFFE